MDGGVQLPIDVLGNERLTVPVDIVCNPDASASHATIRAMSWTKVLVSRALASLDRSWESFARRQGWVEIWTLVSMDMANVGIRSQWWENFECVRIMVSSLQALFSRNGRLAKRNAVSTANSWRRSARAYKRPLLESETSSSTFATFLCYKFTRRRLS